MKIFSCQNCNTTTFFENRSCTTCGFQLGFDANSLEMLALTPAGANLEAVHNKQQFRLCANAPMYDSCNWLIPADSADTLCMSCDLTRTLPLMSDPANVERVRRLEDAKRRMMFSLIALQLPIEGLKARPDGGLCFDFKLDSEEPFVKGKQAVVLTGHNHGAITINALEADPDEIERRKANMGEHYRSLLGHFRHEVGHYYWDVLIWGNAKRLEQCRELFGDERLDYGKALKKHYRNPVQDWQQRFISSYASSHPWEDWAESWAHYMHIIDTLATAGQFNLRVLSQITGKQVNVSAKSANFAEIHARWVTLSTALNSLNRAMGINDPYPFAMPPSAIAKLEFIHSVIGEAGKKPQSQHQSQSQQQQQQQQQ